MATGLTAWCSMPAGSRSRGQGLSVLLRANGWFDKRAPPVPAAILGRFPAYLKKRVKNAVQFVLRVRGKPWPHAARDGGGRRGLRPYPLRRNPADRRDHLLQRWRLGRKLHRAGGGFSGCNHHRGLGCGVCSRGGARASTNAGGRRRTAPGTARRMKIAQLHRCLAPAGETAWCARLATTDRARDRRGATEVYARHPDPVLHVRPARL